IADEMDTAQRMLALEATQLSQRWDRSESPNPVESAVPDPDLPAEAVSPAQRRTYLEALLAHPHASQRLKEHIKTVLAKTPGPGGSGKRKTAKDRAAEPPQPSPAILSAGGAPFRP